MLCSDGGVIAAETLAFCVIAHIIVTAVGAAALSFSTRDAVTI